jgi:hypothetical protein
VRQYVSGVNEGNAPARAAGPRVPRCATVHRMRTIGRSMPELTLLPQAEALRRAAVHQSGGRALARISSTGIAKGVYRFKTQDEADAHVAEGLARVVARNAALQRRER